MGKLIFLICIQYLDKIYKEYTIREDFLCFILIENVFGKGLANSLLTTMKDIDVNLTNMRRQDYDRVHAMSGKFDGCAAKVHELCPDSIYVNFKKLFLVFYYHGEKIFRLNYFLTIYFRIK